jgi:hypothetical protein
MALSQTTTETIRDALNGARIEGGRFVAADGALDRLNAALNPPRSDVMSTLLSGIALHIASEFRERLRAALPPAALTEIDCRNAGADATCASHDFLDANEIMDAAFADVVRRALNSDSGADAKLWNDA